MNFKFRRLNFVEVSDNGLNLVAESVYHSIRFGEFINKNEKIIFEVIFYLKKADPGNVAFGFMTPEFKEELEQSNHVNWGENHSCCLTGNGYFVDSPTDFTSNHVSKGYMHELARIWNENDKLHVEIDMIDEKGRMWNDADKQKNILFEIGLPESAAIFIDVAGDVNVAAIHQQFRYKK